MNGVLGDFGRIDIFLNKADDYVINRELIAAQGDYHGRTMRVQITNDGQLVDMTGSTLNFSFYRTDNKKNGVYPFTEIDETHGVYEVEYPTEMTADGKGYVLAQISIVHEGSRIDTEDFMIRVVPDLLTEDAFVADNNISVLNKNILDVNYLTNEIVIVEATMAEIMSQYESLNEYLTTQLALKSDIQSMIEKVDQISLDTSQVKEIRDIVVREDSQKDKWYQSAKAKATKTIPLTGGYPPAGQKRTQTLSNTTLLEINGSGTFYGIMAAWGRNYTGDFKYATHDSTIKTNTLTIRAQLIATITLDEKTIIINFDPVSDNPGGYFIMVTSEFNDLFPAGDAPKGVDKGTLFGGELFDIDGVVDSVQLYPNAPASPNAINWYYLKEGGLPFKERLLVTIDGYYDVAANYYNNSQNTFTYALSALPYICYSLT